MSVTPAFDPEDNGPIMAEFLKHEVELEGPDIATIAVYVRPSRGLWATRRKTKKVQVEVVSRGVSSNLA